MLRIMISIIAVLAIVVVGCGVTQPPVAPPAAPADVLSVWHSPPSPQGYPPDMAGEVHLGKYTSSNYEYAFGDSFFLQNYQWVDIVVKSKNIPVKFYDEEPETVHFGVMFRYVWNCQNSSYSPDSEDLGGDYVTQTASPLCGKILYGQPIQERTRSGDDTIYSVAVRLFMDGGNCNGSLTGSECMFGFVNYNIYEEADISYEICKLDVTPGWGVEGEYWNNVLIPWMTERLGGAYNEDDLSLELYEEWYEQFK